MAESVAIDYGWFRPADLKKTFEAIHSIDLPGPIILVGGQSLATWVRYFKMELPPFEGPYLTADADFKGSTKQAEVLATKLDGTVKKPTWDDNTPNTALITLSSETGERITIDFLNSVLGIKTEPLERLAVMVSIEDWKPIKVLHPLHVLISRCENLYRLSEKRNSNGITQAKVACAIAEKYIEDCLRDKQRHREALKAAKFISQLGKSRAGVYVWAAWGINVMEVIDPLKMPGDFQRSWLTEVAKVSAKRSIAKVTMTRKTRGGFKWNRL